LRNYGETIVHVVMMTEAERLRFVVAQLWRAFGPAAKSAARRVERTAAVQVAP
jgi:hypothetical protein